MRRADAEALDAVDELAWARRQFRLPEGLLYFDGNSLGPLTHASRERLRRVTDLEWGEDLITSWTGHDWIGLARSVGAKIAPLVGAEPDQVVVCDSVSVNLLKVLAAAVGLRPEARTLLCQADHFPTDLYVAQGLAQALGRDYEVRYVEVDDLERFWADDPKRHDVAVLCLSHVDFRSGHLLSMGPITEQAQAAGAAVVWDLSHSAGALPVHLDACRVDFAVGCTYKFLNGGPGAPAFLYAARRHLPHCRQPLQGWLGHREPFAFRRHYEPADGIDRFVSGTPPILALASLDAALDLWLEVDIVALRRKSEALGELFLDLVQARLGDLNDGEPGWSVASPRRPSERGSQICLGHPEAYAVMQALIERRLVGDFREPDILRFGLTPLYHRYVDVWDAVTVLERVLRDGVFKDPRFSARAKVT